MWPMSGKRLSKNAHHTLPRKPVPPTTTRRLPDNSRPRSSRGTEPFVVLASAVSGRSTISTGSVAARGQRDVAHHDWRHVQACDVERLVLAVLGLVQGIFHVRRGLVAEQFRDVLVIGADHDHAPDVLTAVL